MQHGSQAQQPPHPSLALPSAAMGPSQADTSLALPQASPCQRNSEPGHEPRRTDDAAPDSHRQQHLQRQTPGCTTPSSGGMMGIKAQHAAASPATSHSRGHLESGSMHGMSGSWADHASKMRPKSPLHGATIERESVQDSPASGQSTQDLIEGIEMRYQQARAILRSYQR